MGLAEEVRLDPDHRLLLWDPSFGPIPGVTPSWSEETFKAWLDSEAVWLGNRFGASRLSVALADDYEVEWVEDYPVGSDTLPRGHTAPGVVYPAGDLVDLVAALIVRQRDEGNTAVGLEEGIEALVARGPALGSLAQKALFEPLGLSNTVIDFAPFSAVPPAPKDAELEQAFRTSATAEPTRLWSDAGDLAALLAQFMKAAAGKPGSRLSSADVQTLMKAPRDSISDALGPAREGPGLAIANSGSYIRAISTGHGFTILWVGFPEVGKGAVVLSNTGLAGLTLAVEIVQRLAIHYNWPTVPRFGG